jgi:hypothetical protein
VASEPDGKVQESSGGVRLDSDAKMSRSYGDRDIKLLWGLAAARCSFADCRARLVEDASDQDGEVVLGKIAHIVAHSPGGPRADPLYPASDLDKYPNLILLCGTHHDVVDGQSSTYSVATLQAMKTEHERWVAERLTEEVANLSFVQLEMVTSSILKSPAGQLSDLALVPPEAKIERNSLSNQTSALISLGMAQFNEVRAFIEAMADYNDRFPEELSAGFVDEYKRLVEEGTQGDYLFEEMRVFASGNPSDFRRQAAGLAVLAYLFVICEVFEK